MATKKINGVYHVSNTQTGGSGDDPNAVKYVEQELTEAQQTQARTNIGALGEADILDPLMTYTHEGDIDPLVDPSAYATEEELNQLSQEVSGSEVLQSDSFIGGWGITASAYSKDSNPNRVGINEFQLHAGDKIILSDYTKCRMYIGWKLPDNTHGRDGWLSQDFTASVDATYVVTLEGIPSATVSDKAELAKYFFVERAVSQIFNNYQDIQDNRDRIIALEGNLSPLLDGKLPAMIPANDASAVLSYDSTAKTITIPAQTVIRIEGGYKSNDNAVTLTIPSGYTSAIFVIYDSSTDNYSIVPYTQTLTKNQYIVAGLRQRGSDSKFSTPLPWKTDNLRYGIKIRDYQPNLLLCGVPSLYGKYCDYDVALNTFTVPRDTVIKCGVNDLYALPAAATIDISASAIATSAILILFDISAKNFSIIGYSDAIPDGKQIFACIRRNSTNPGVCCAFPWSINGNAYGIVLPQTEKMRGYTRGINHRGYNTIAPENTLPAFKMSREKGFVSVECDVRFTSDGVPVILHDDSINRTATNSDGSAIGSTVNIADITYEQALTYDFGRWKGDAYIGTKIPTFEQLLSLCRNLGLHLYIEIKAGTQAQVEGLVDMVRQYGMLNRVSWISFSLARLTYVKDKDGKARLGYLATPTSQTVLDISGIKTTENEVFFDSSDYGQTEVSLCKSANIPLEVWVIDSISTIEGLDPYISGVTSDYNDASLLLLDANL